MSQLIINRFFKPSLCKNFLRHTRSNIGHVRLLSSTTHTSNGLDTDSDHEETPTWSYYTSSFATSHPYLLVDHILTTKDNGMIKDKSLLYEVSNAMTAGFSRDGLNFDLWYNYENNKKSSLRPTIEYDPSNPKVKRMYVHLPPLPIGTQIQNLAMSSLPTQDKDWVVGVKLSGSRVSFCRPYGSCQWVDLKTKPQSIHPYASIMFSKKDKKFYVPTPGGNYLCSWNPNPKEELGEEELEFIDVEFENFPKSVFDDLAGLSSCSKVDHLVESPTGQLFLVKWCGEDVEVYDDDKDGMNSLLHSVKQFMVFRAEEEYPGKTMIYTEDIGDLCIFLGHSEAFCVPASSSPGLKPNCIYFVGYNFGVYDLTTKTCTIFHDKDHVSLSKSEFPYWPPPVPLN